MKKYLTIVILLLPIIIFAQNNSNTIYITQINDLSFFNTNSKNNYEFSFIYKNPVNIKNLTKQLNKSKNVESCSFSNNNVNIRFNTNKINIVSKTFLDNNINFLDLNNKIIPIEYIKIDKTTIPPPDNNVEMRDDNILYHEYIISSIKFKLHYMQSSLSKLSNAAKTGHLSSMYNQITKEQETISELNE